MNPLPIWLKFTLAGIVLSGLWWRVDVYAHRDWSVDESNTFRIGQGEFKPFWKLENYCEAHSFPGDYVLTYPFIQFFHKDKWGLVIPQFLSTLLGFYLLWLLCRRYFKHPLAWIITFLIFALHRELIFHSMEMRPYSILETMGLGTFYILDSLINPALSVSRLKCALWWMVLILTIVFHPYGMFMIACCGLFLLLRDWRKSGFMALIRRRWIFWACLFLVGVPLWLYYLQGDPLSSPHAMKAHQFEVFQYIPNPLVNPLGFFKSAAGGLVGSKLAYVLSLGALIRLVWPRKNRMESWGFTAIIIVLPVLLPLISDAAYGYWFLQRQYIWVMAIFPFFVGKCWDEMISMMAAKKERTLLCP
jgi:hypothetical protein